MTKIQKARKRSGLCVRCGKAAKPDTTLCRHHTAVNRAAVSACNKRKRAAAKAGR
jgi:hypothetical protein